MLNINIKEYYVEDYIIYDCELSICGCKTNDEIICYEPVINTHKNSILIKTEYNNSDYLELIDSYHGNTGWLAIKDMVIRQAQELEPEPAPESEPEPEEDRKKREAEPIDGDYEVPAAPVLVSSPVFHAAPVAVSAPVHFPQPAPLVHHAPLHPH